jgi:hypothetical protein
MSDDPKDPTGLRYYGSDMTIHAGGEVNVELDASGSVVSVWFRCQPLPFTQTTTADSRAEEMRRMYARQPAPPIEAIVLRDQP